jgi:hypothetical protein
MEALEDFKFNKFSQNGEDGVVQEILSRISSQTNLNRWCCEFGAWDGIHLSNTARLILEDNFKAVLIEGNPLRLKDLQTNFPEDSVTKICSFVTPSGRTTLENLLCNTEIPPDFDFLSIDIDGMDYWILKSLEKYKPKVICIEFNQSIPNIVEFVQVPDPKIKHGSSARSIADLGQLMGYSVVAATYCNLLLVRDEFVNTVVGSLPSLEELIPDGNNPQFLFCGYDGTILSNRTTVDLVWHGLFSMENVQILPKYLRKFRGDYNFLQKIFFRVLYFLNSGNNAKLSIIKSRAKIRN